MEEAKEQEVTQYESILKALRKAGNKGCTVRDLLQFSNAPWKRISELEDRFFYSLPEYDLSCQPGQVNEKERIERHERQHNGRTLRVYVLKRVK